MSWMYDEWLNRPFGGGEKLPGSVTNAEYIARAAERKKNYLDYNNALKNGDNETALSLVGKPGAYKTDLEHLTLEEAIDNLFTGNYTYQRQLDQFNKQAAFNAEEAQKQRDYEMKLANTAYQRQVADLGAAGYNPSLALGAGGAYVPSGASASARGGSYSESPHGFEFTMRAIIAAIGLGIKAVQSGADVALAKEKAYNIANLSDSKKEYLTNTAYRNYMQGHVYDRLYTRRRNPYSR